MFNVDQLRLDIEALLREYPELFEDEAARLDTLDGATDLRDVLSRLANSYEDTLGLEVGVQSRIGELEARAERFNRRGVLIREMIFRVLESANLKKVELPEVTLSLRNNRPHLVGDADPMRLPDDLCKITRSINRGKIREAIENGHPVEGFALSNSAPSLVVKVK